MIIIILLLIALLGNLCLKAVYSKHFKALNINLRWTMSYATGLMLTSTLFFLLNRISIPPLLIALLLVAGIGYLWKRTESSADQYNPMNIRFPNFQKKNWLSIVLSTFIFTSLGIGTYLFFIDTYNEPHGLNDAWSYWNLRAKFIARNPSGWANAFSDLYFFHGDYPLFETGLIGFIWSITGKESIFVPAFLCLSFYWMIVWAVYGFIKELGSKINAELAALFLSLTPFYVVMLSSQYVDMQAGLYFLMAVGISVIAINSKNNLWYILTGLFAFGAGWVKNEGLLFIIVFFACLKLYLLLKDRKNWIEKFKYAIMGAALPLLSILIFKLWIAPTNDLIQEGGDLFSKLNDPYRFHFIADFWKVKITDFGKWIGNPWWLLLIYIPAAGLNVSFIKKHYWTYAVIIGMLVGFFMIYMVSYIDLFFHLSTSAHRLFFQLLPVFLFIYFASLKAPFKEA
jgi:hypothetical protein